MIVIIDYGAGNLRSVVNAVTALGYRPEVTGRPADVLDARGVILPGVGAAGEAIENLKKLKLVEAIERVIQEDRPFLGICLGLQLLLSRTEEDAGHSCLNIIPGRVTRFSTRFKVPHMGWNQVKQKVAHPIFAGIPDNANFYFVHSYYGRPEDRGLIAGETDYGVHFCSVLARGNLVATQFHPEKSGDYGLRLFDNFLKIASGKPVR